MSRVSDWISAQKTGTVISGLGERAKISVTCRLDELHVQMLERLANDLGMTRTACAEKMLDLTITDAWTEWYGKPPSPTQLWQMTEYSQIVQHAKALAVEQLSGVNDEEAKRLLVDAKVVEVRLLGALHSIRLSLGEPDAIPASAPIIASFHVNWLAGKDVNAVAENIIASLRKEVSDGQMQLNNGVLDSQFFDQRFYVRVNQNPKISGAYRVTFNLKQLQAARGPNGAPKKVLRSPCVVVYLGDATPQTRFEPGEEELPGVTAADFEREAIERALAAQERSQHLAT